MDKLITDNPQDNFSTVMNMVYGKDGWQYIRHDEGMLTTDFCLMLCKERNCEMPDYDDMTTEAKDEMLSDCAFDGCPVASVYAALSGLGHIRNRLKAYEDTGFTPDGIIQLEKQLAQKDAAIAQQATQLKEAVAKINALREPQDWNDDHA